MAHRLTDHLDIELTRRELIGGALVAAASLIVAGCGTATLPSRQPEAGKFNADVLVIGAGIAGLAAANRLAGMGLRVVVVEARDRIGGRVHSINLAGAPVEIGANWVHGTDGNPLMDLLRKARVGSIPAHDMYPQLIGADKAAVEAAYTAFERASAQAERIAEELDEDISMATALARARSTSADGAERWVEHSEIDLEIGVEPELISAWWGSESMGFGEAERLVTGGYGRVAEELAQGITLRTEATVTRLRVLDDTVIASIDGRGPSRVTTRAAILTAPPSTWDAIAFEPGLPDHATGAADRLGMASLEKVILRVRGGAGLDRLTILGDATDWGERRIRELYVVPDADGAAATVIGLTGGSMAKHLVRDGERAMIAAAVETIGAHAPGFDSSDVLGARASAWSADPFARGSYSYLPVGSTPKDRAALRRPMHGRILFAGEAASTSSPSTVHGALLEGRRAADDVQSLLRSSGY